MGLRGPKPARPDGLHVTRKGYLRGTFDGRLRHEHDVIWERERGPIPNGCVIHHLNGDKQDNRIANLAAVDAVTHKRLHSGCDFRAGQWWKPCHVCGGRKPVGTADWYLSPEGWPLYGRCRPCHIRIVIESKRLRKMRKAAA